MLRSLALLLFLASASAAADWPQFLGPTRDSATPEKVAAWTAEPKVLWKQPLGDAHSSPVVVSNIVYAFYQPKKKDADALAAFDAKTGDLLWEKSYEREKFTPPFGKGPRSTPAVANGRVFTLGNTGILACWDAKTGEVKWKVDTLARFASKNLFFGISTSPVVVGDTVVVMIGGKGAGLVALNVADGETAWTALDDAASYSSPFVYGAGANAKVIALTGANLVGITAAGNTDWKTPFKDRMNESSTTPVKAGDLVLGSSVTAGSIVLRVSEKAGAMSAEKVWADKKLTCYFSTPVVVGKYIYMVNGAATLLNPAVSLRCVELETGKVQWEKSNIGRYHAALVRTGDDKLLMLDDNGGLALVQPDATGYKELARAKVCGPTWAHPAVVEGRLYLRDEKELFCVDLIAGK